MATRFHIEELLSQDLSGVIFRAVDQESGQEVAVRRFFPHGADGGGLKGEERIAYDIAIQRLSQASHPALRSVIDGGCDPIDGVPFVVTELIEGQPISEKIAAGPLASRQAIDIIMRALEVSDVLSQLLAEQAVWVETNPASIVDAGEGSERGVTFWISPLKWLGTDENRRSLKPIVALTEDLMGWKNKLVNDQAGNNLAGWLKWLRQYADSTTIAEARETLAAATGAPPPPPTARLVHQATATRMATRPMASRAAVTVVVEKKPKRPSGLPLVLSLVALGLILGLGAWVWVKGEIPFIGKFLPKEVVAAVETEGPPPVVDPAIASLAPAGPFQPGDLRPLMSLAGKPASVVGLLARVRYSDSGKTLFLEFEDLPPLTYACGAIRKANAPADMTPETLAPLVGKKIVISGIVDVDRTGDTERPQLFLKGRESIESSE